MCGLRQERDFAVPSVFFFVFFFVGHAAVREPSGAALWYIFASFEDHGRVLFGETQRFGVLSR